MFFILIFFFAFLIFNLDDKKKKFNDTDLFNQMYTLQINGIFVFLVFLRHFSGYTINNSIFSKIIHYFNSFLGQCVVTSFLLYSGYGIMEGLKRNKSEYLNKIKKQKIPKLLLRFDICVILYFIINIIAHKHYPLNQIVLSFIGLTSIGNSNWYIFYILISYLFIIIAFSFTNKTVLSNIILFFLNFIYIIFFLIFNKEETQFYLTCFVLLFGSIISIYKEKIIILLEKYYKRLFIITFSLYIVFFSFYTFLRIKNISIIYWVWIYNCIAILFSILLILFTFKIKFNNKTLTFLGNYVFEIYILQRIPMNLLHPIYKQYYCNSIGEIIYFVLCLIITIILAKLIRYFFNIVGI